MVNSEKDNEEADVPQENYFDDVVNSENDNEEADVPQENYFDDVVNSENDNEEADVPQENYFDDVVNSENDDKEADVPYDKNYYQAIGVNNVTSSVLHCLQYRDNNVDTRRYADNVRIGGTGGGLLNVNTKGNPKARITWIKVHAQPHSIRSIEIDYLVFKDAIHYQPKRYKCGRPEGESREYLFRFGERITQLRYWGNKKCGLAGRVMKIEFRTNLGGHFEIGQTIGLPYIPVIGSGIPGGMLSKCGSDVDAFALLLYK